MAWGLPTLFTLLLSATGAYSFGILSIPGGMLCGGALLVAIAAVCRGPAHVPVPLRDGLFVCVGLIMGASVSGETLQLIGRWPITLASLALELAVIVWVSAIWLQHRCGLDRPSSYLSSFPGHLSFIVALASAGVGDARRITIIQTERVMALTLFAPMIAIFAGTPPAAGAAAAPPMDPLALAVLAGGCVAVGWLLTRLRMPAGYVLGSMAVATTVRLAGWVPGSLPVWLEHAVFIGMGALVGSRFAGISMQEFRKTLGGGMVAVIVSIVVTTLFALVLSRVVDMPLGQLWLALSPGGLESMGTLGLALGYDTAFIGAHHLARVMILSFAIPIAAFLFRRPSAAEKLPIEPSP